MDHFELGGVQVFVGVDQRPPDETDENSSKGDEGIPAMVSECGEEGYVQGDKAGTQREQVVVGGLALLSYVLRCLNEQFVLLQKMVLVFLAIFLRRSALELARQSASTADEDFQVVPSPVVHVVG